MPDAPDPAGRGAAPGVRTLALDLAAPAGGLDGLLDAVRRAGSDPEVRCLVLTGREFGAGVTADHAGALPALVGALVALPQPVVAAVRGTTRDAGLALACAADLRVLADDAVLRSPLVDGVPAEGGLSWTLPRLVGHGRAGDLLLRASGVRALEADAWGLATRVVPDAEVEAVAHALAAEVAGLPALAVAATKRSLAHGSTDGLVATMQVEAQRAAMLRRACR